ncbi:MAG: beta-carotene 15,15'-monooxygenase [Flavobacteriaceae bacterium]|jgi:hypothetical protein|nr:beta-carotene 15,15'-monooxygenase [Flavobacteriaceae bacterium]
MPEFELDNFKKTWQQQDFEPKYNNSEILEMLNKKSRNYVKYILWISIAEFLFFTGITVYYLINGDEENSFMRILERLGVSENVKLAESLNHIYDGLKALSLLITAFFVVKFYQNYKKIRIESNLKKFILQIIRFRKTVNIFILTNITLLIISILILTFFIFNTLSNQNIHLEEDTFIAFITGLIIGCVFSIGLIWFYYRIVYGIIMKKLGKNLKQLEEIEMI